MKKQLIILVLLLLLNISAPAQEITKIGTTVASFLNIDTGAKAIGMGSAFVSIANDVSSIYWNPSGLARLESKEVQFTYNRWIADISYNHVGIGIPLSANIGTIGVGAAFLGMDEMHKTTTFSPEGTGEKFDAGSYAFTFSYARQLTDRFSFGLNAKYINETIYHCTADAFAMDFGLLFTTRFNGLQLGMSISNYGTKMQMDGRDLIVQKDIAPDMAGNNSTINAKLMTEAYDLPLLFRVGISMDVLKQINNHSLILAVDALHPNDDVEMVNVGAEYVFNGMYVLRAGYKSLFALNAEEEGLSLGGGLNIGLGGLPELKVDYAYKTFGLLGNVQMFTVGLGF